VGVEPTAARTSVAPDLVWKLDSFLGCDLLRECQRVGEAGVEEVLGK
jgi:hypothetical protein